MVMKMEEKNTPNTRDQGRSLLQRSQEQLILDTGIFGLTNGQRLSTPPGGRLACIG